jgi:DNA-binding transcriptional LysR family regulator
MDFRSLECFVAVAEDLHFGRAAARLGMAQPPLSQRVKALEEELGVGLFARTSRKVGLTPAGEAFLVEAREVLARVERAGETARRVGQGLGGRLTVGFVNPAMDAFLAGAVARFRQLVPEVALTLREMSTPEQVAALGAGRLDVGFIRFAGQKLAGLEAEVIFREPYLAALPAEHVLAGRGRVTLGRLVREPLIMPPPGDLPALRAAMDEAFARVGGNHETVQEARSKFTVLSLVAAGVGVALVPASARVWRRRGVVFREVVGVLPEVELAAAWPRGRDHPAAARLVALAREGEDGQ